MAPAPHPIAFRKQTVDPDPALQGRALVPVVENGLPVVTKSEPTALYPALPFDTILSAIDAEGGFTDLCLNVNPRKLSPRQMAEISMDLYMTGVLSWDEYAMLAFQPDLHPDFNATVGALTGEKATPDQPRDFVAEWKQRLDFEERYNTSDTDVTERTRHILDVLRMLYVRARLLNINI